ncbi:MAG: mechanosensitive ion channel family protein [Corynebacterium sp.]|uniref:mechanosensitive ion channel family protein n=1 Tax=Corynebacterium sp. TaxID=1720 RepID=UPI0026DD578C|nr:mechanosensitive ion channel family protein [Corynebacterium sp.]MDO5029360.1 mechanosensitive ion channel family protein [Corynebacterium sp.]
MEFLQYMLLRAWQWVANNGLSIACLTILLILVPRIRRFILAMTSGNMSSEDEQSKGKRALIGAVVYLVEVIAYFVLIIAILSKFGISLTAAAIPATVVSAAVGFGAQGVIADFLGGVFIIAEKQYGVGDWVEFHSPSGTVQGDVVNMTLRATTIRTLNGEEIIVPNSESRMCINYSSQWSRAVVEVPVPMTAGGSIKDLEERTVAAAEHAISLDSIKDAVLSDITLQSSTELNPPTVMGLPWTVTMRLVVDCKPGDQWLIERAIRAAVIDTWWDDYGERAQKTPFEPAEEVTGHARDDAMIEQLNAAKAKKRDDADSTPTELVPTVADAETAKTAVMATQAVDKQDDVARSDIPHAGEQLDEARREQEEQDDEIKKLTSHPEWSTLTTRQKARRILSAGGRARVSTIVLLVTLVILAILNLMTVETENGPSGWLAPSRWSDRVATKEEKTTEPTSSQVSETPTTTQQDVQTTETTAPNTQEQRTTEEQTTENTQQPTRTQQRQQQTTTETTEPTTEQNDSGTGDSQSSDSTNQVEPNSATVQ